MLARLAENLFWAGRYAERAEDTARMVDVTYHGLLESPPAEVRLAWVQLLEVLHLDEAYARLHDDVDPAAIIRFLVSDESNPGSVMASVTNARENVRSVRELVSTELWEATNGLYLQLKSRDLAADLAQPYDLFREVKRGGQLITGVATETMPRDDGWRFMTLGRMLERCEMTCRLLSIRYTALVESAASTAFHHWVAVLKSVSAFEAFRKSYRSSMDPRDVVEFLLLSPVFPRSVLFCLQAGEAQLERLSGGSVGGTARRRLGRVRAAIEYRNVDELLDEGLQDALEQVQVEVLEVAAAVREEFFQQTPVGSLHAVGTS